jgi:hypothetical protein
MLFLVLEFSQVPNGKQHWSGLELKSQSGSYFPKGS